MSVFHELHPRLQRAIVSRLGWSSLRPVQELSGQAILADANTVILAPTAGGKTEAAMFPILSRLLTDEPRGLGALYIAPIKALLNNQADRLGLYTEMVGLRRFVWHGDIGGSARQRFLRDPATLLMTTPESLEVMLVSQKVNAEALFADLRFVVIDEIHALAGSDRGTHLMSVLERLAVLSKHDLQRAGLSATVGNPEAILGWLKGSSSHPGQLVKPPVPNQPRELLVVHREALAELARDAARESRGRKSLFFCESRSTTESVAKEMQKVGTEVFVHHSSISKDERAEAEKLFHQGGDACIVCTSTLELGIDIGDLDRVFQAEAPGTVSSFLQRMGRTGRRAGKRANTMFLCQSSEAVLQASALIELAKRGWVEAVEVEDRAWPVMIHQLLAMSLADGGITPEAAWIHFGRVPDFQGIRRPEFDRLLNWMLADGALVLVNGRLALGPKAEKRFGRFNFMDLYAVFSTPALYKVVTVNGRDIGTLSQEFVDRLVSDVSTFLLGGKAWSVFQVNHKDKLVRVTAAPKGREPTWGGVLPQFLGFDLCQQIAASLQGEGEPGYLHPSAAEVLRRWRQDLGEVLSRGGIEADADEVTWWTFAGGRINSTLRYALQAQHTDWKVIPGNFSVRVRAEGVDQRDLRAAIARMRDLEFWEDPGLWRGVLAELPSYRLSKFQPLMPPWVEREVLARFLLDLKGAWGFLSERRRWVAIAAQQALEEALADTEVVAPEPEVAPTPGVTPSIPIVYVEEQAAFEAVCAELAQASVVALDVETTLDKGQSLCLVQLGVPERSVLIDPLAVTDLEPLRAILESPQITKLIHNANFEKRVLGRYGFDIVQVYDTLTVSRQLRGRKIEGGHSLKVVCKRELGIDISKDNQTSDWSRRPLDPGQIDYAALDVELLLRLHEIFSREQPDGLFS